MALSKSEDGPAHQSCVLSSSVSKNAETVAKLLVQIIAAFCAGFFSISTGLAAVETASHNCNVSSTLSGVAAKPMFRTTAEAQSATNEIRLSCSRQITVQSVQRGLGSPEQPHDFTALIAINLIAKTISFNGKNYSAVISDENFTGTIKGSQPSDLDTVKINRLDASFVSTEGHIVQERSAIITERKGKCSTFIQKQF